MRYLQCNRGHTWSCDGCVAGHGGEICPKAMRGGSCGQPLKYKGTKKPTGIASKDIPDLHKALASRAPVVATAPTAATFGIMTLDAPVQTGSGPIPTAQHSALPVSSSPHSQPAFDQPQQTFPSSMVPPTVDSSLMQIDQPLLVSEARSQADLTQIFAQDANIQFLCRSGQFGIWVQPSEAWAANEAVDEPGFCKGNPVTHSGQSVLIGRNEVSTLIRTAGFQMTRMLLAPDPCVKGGVTYPDFVLKIGSKIFAIELKTPRGASLASFFDQSFYEGGRRRGVEGFEDTRSVLDEIKLRQQHLPSDCTQVLAIDVRHMGLPLDVLLKTLHEEVISGQKGEFWALIDSVLLVTEKSEPALCTMQDLRAYTGTRQSSMHSFLAQTQSQLQVSYLGRSGRSTSTSGVEDEPASTTTTTTQAVQQPPMAAPQAPPLPAVPSFPPASFGIGPCMQATNNAPRIVEARSGQCVCCLLNAPHTAVVNAVVGQCGHCNQQVLTSSSGICSRCAYGTDVQIGVDLRRCATCGEIDVCDQDTGMCAKNCL